MSSRGFRMSRDGAPTHRHFVVHRSLGVTGFLTLLILFFGCAPSADKPTPAASSQESPPPTSFTVIDHVTQRSKVVQGRQAMDQVRQISADKNAALDEIRTTE